MKDAELDALLARGRLSGPTRERVLANVLDQVQPPRSRHWAKTAAFVLLPAAAALALFVGVGRWGSTLSGAHGEGGGFEAKGTASDVVHVDAACTGGPMLACPRGSRLVFHVQAGARPGYLAAYADPAAGGERVWYISAEGESPLVQSGTLERAILIGPEHAADRYVIHALVSGRPLARAEAAQPKPAALLGADSFELRLVP
jgi:hypothetical protein